jgi:RNA polymerase sigma-70 factor, ECF subfamily
MGRLVAGDADAIRTLYSRFGPPIYSLGVRMLGSSESAEELTQDVFVMAWRKGSAFDAARGRLSTWLMAIAHNIAVDRLRHERGRTRPPMVFMDELPEPPPRFEEDVLVERETARRALMELSVQDRDLLVRTYFQGSTAREISEADGIPLGTVKTRLRAALIRLRKLQAEQALRATRLSGGGFE